MISQGFLALDYSRYVGGICNYEEMVSLPISSKTSGIDYFKRNKSEWSFDKGCHNHLELNQFPIICPHLT